MIFSHSKPSNYYQLKIPTRNVSNTFTSTSVNFSTLSLCTPYKRVKKFKQKHVSCICARSFTTFLLQQLAHMCVCVWVWRCVRIQTRIYFIVCLIVAICVKFVKFIVHIQTLANWVCSYEECTNGEGERERKNFDKLRKRFKHDRHSYSQSCDTIAWLYNKKG